MASVKTLVLFDIYPKKKFEKIDFVNITSFFSLNSKKNKKKHLHTFV